MSPFQGLRAIQAACPRVFTLGYHRIARGGLKIKSEPIVVAGLQSPSRKSCAYTKTRKCDAGPYKTVEVLYAIEDNTITVVTVEVYYSDEEES